MSQNKIKKDTRDWFDLYTESMTYTRDAADILHTMVSGQHPAAFPASVDKIKNLEHRCDHCLHHFFECLQHAFITPFDRDDMGDMMRHMDNICDYIDDAANAFPMYHVHSVRPAALTLTRGVRDCVSKLLEAVVEFRRYKSSKTLQSLTIEVNRLEEEGDRLYRQAMSDLFLHEKDPVEIIRWKDIYTILENILDACEDVADSIQNIFLNKD